MVARSTGSVFAEVDEAGAHDRNGEVTIAKAHVMAGLFGTPERARLGRYELEARIGEGAHGRVYRAFDPQLRRRVAIKVLRDDGSVVPLEVRRARAAAEAHGLARVHHPGVVAVYDVGTGEGPWGEPALYIVMELVDGPDLAGWLALRPRTWPEVLGVGLLAGRGLAAAHRAGLVHRDVKPGNVLVGAGGAAKVADFGLVARGEPSRATLRSGQARDVDTRLTATGHVLGTPLYMPPEQHESQPVEARADQYALCVTLWEALHGAPPFAGSSIAALHASKLEGPPDPPTGSDVPVAISRVLARGLAVDPASRFANLDDFIAALEAATPGGSRRRSAILGGALAAMALVAGAGAWLADPGACDPAVSGWRAEAGEAIEAAFVATGRTDARERAGRVAQELDAWHAHWGEASQAACGDPAGQQPLAAVHECLARAWDERTALLSVLGDADARVVGRAVTAIATLPSPSDCAAGRPLPESEGPKPARRSLARVRALQAAGREREAWMLAQEVLESLHRDDPLWVEAAFRVGRLEFLAREGRATRTLEDVYHHALAKDDARMAAASGAQLLQIHARADEPSIAATWDRHTQAALGRAGDPDDVRLVWLHGRAMLAQRTGRVPDAIVAYDEAASVATQIGATEQAASSIGMRGLARRDIGELGAAEDDLREALLLAEDLYGLDDVRLHATLQNLGSVLMASGTHAEAREVLERARDLVARHRGPAASEAIDILELLGLLAYEEDDLDRATILLSDVLAARERDPDALPRKRAHACFNLANVQAARGDLDAASRHQGQAVRWLEEAVGPEHPEVAYVLAALADVQRERGEHAAAVGHLERAEAILAGARVPAARRAELAEIRAKIVAAAEAGPP